MKNILSMLLALALCATASAAPGAHGPNGEHLDAPSAHDGVHRAPGFETFTEAFEMVGNLSGGELSILIDRYDSNEPVLNGKLELQYKDIKAQATFHPDAGDYVFSDKKLLAALSAPGKHALVFTFVAGEESDLLDAALVVEAHEEEAHTSRRWLWLAGAVAGVGAAAFAASAWQRTRRQQQGGQP